ncbi:hypothetical protein O9X98_04650 [Agrobacterium salinitolerans]|nr:hypothetical protein [Agrobacterium salinitolerans]
MVVVDDPPRLQHGEDMLDPDALLRQRGVERLCYRGIELSLCFVAADRRQQNFTLPKTTGIGLVPKDRRASRHTAELPVPDRLVVDAACVDPRDEMDDASGVAQDLQLRNTLLLVS